MYTLILFDQSHFISCKPMVTNRPSLRMCLCVYVHVCCVLYPSAVFKVAVADKIQQTSDWGFAIGWCNNDKLVYICGALEYFM